MQGVLVVGAEVIVWSVESLFLAEEPQKSWRSLLPRKASGAEHRHLFTALSVCFAFHWLCIFCQDVIPANAEAGLFLSLAFWVDYGWY